jgi:hypothetical protein
LILFFENPKDIVSLHKAIWNLNESPIAIIVENNVIEIFNGFSIDENTKLLKSLGGESELTDFSYFQLVTGKTWEKYANELEYKNRVDYHLLQKLENVQKILILKIGLSREIANALLGKIIFIRYLIDRKVCLNFKKQHKQWTKDDLCILLRDREETWSFIKYLQNEETGFNGDMFKLEEKEFEQIPQEALNIIIQSLQGVDVATGEQLLFDLYDFSILPIEFISNVYEKFIGKENQDAKSAYYTPTFLVDYIVEQTIGKKLQASDDYNCKVLDPACGSGIFLVESLRRIIEKYIQINNIKDTNTSSFRKVLCEIVTNNIYGIDKDYSAVQVAIFSVYLTLLDYQQPADIENFKFPNLMGTNFICSDTFDLNNPQLKDFENKKIAFDYIIGNPPWRRGRIEKDENGNTIIPDYQKYINKKTESDKSCSIGNKELAQAFLVRSLDFSSENTQSALIVTSKVLYNLQSKDFRSYLLDKLFINKVFELAPVRREVFDKSNDKAIAPACVLFYKNALGENTDSNIIEHIALKPSRFFHLFKVFTLTKNDVQKVQQKMLKEYDWLWKVLVYGSYLDFNFIQRLKKNYRNIEAIINNDSFIKRQGIKEKDRDKRYNVSELIGWNYLPTQNVIRWHCAIEEKKWNKEQVGYVYRKNNEIVLDIYKAPILVITGGTQNDLKAVSAITYDNCVYKSSLTGIKGFGNNTIQTLRNICGILNSSFFSYYNIITFSSSGIEREETHDEEKLSVPYCEQKIDIAVEEMESLMSEKCNSTLINSSFEQKIKIKKERIDSLIYEGFNCSPLELDLINYANNVSIPIAIKHNGYEKLFEAISFDSNVLEEYAQVYIDRFSPSLNRDGNNFIVEIWYTKQIIGMLFKVVSDKGDKQEIDKRNKQKDTALISFISNLSSQQITERLFVQKDIRGFEKDYFYIFKPNEKRLWHRAIAYLDANEFADAMLKIGRDDNDK